MKIERKIEPPKLWQWARGRLPKGLHALTDEWGYGHIHGIWALDRITLGRRLTHHIAGDLYRPKDPIALISKDKIELFNPSYFSDFEDLARAYESETGHEVMLAFWQSPKDARKSA